MRSTVRRLEQVYLFAQQIEAAVVEGSNRNVYLFTMKKVLVEVTKHYTNLFFLEQLKIKSMVEKYKKNTFTSKEPAKDCGISVKNMDRVIEKLMSSGYACISSMRNQAETRRPSRILIFYT